MPTMDVCGMSDRLEDAMLDATAIDVAGEVLDLGCATGIATPAIARRPARVFSPSG